MERRGNICFVGTIAASPIQILFFLVNLANLVMLCFGEETIVFDRVWKEHIIRSEGQTVTLRCISKGNVTMFRIETLKNDSKAKIVMNSTLVGNYTGSYIFNSTKNGSDFMNDLTIRDVTREFDGSLFHCVDHITFNALELTLIVLYSPRREYPQCKSSSTFHTFFTDQIGEPFDLTCISEEGNQSINLSLENTLTMINSSSVTLGENKTHRYVELNAKLDRKWNNSMFYCYVVQSSPGMVNYSANCSFGPIQFVDELTIITNTSNVSFKEGKRIMFSCKSNVNAAYKQWNIVDIPKHVSYSSSNDSDLIYLEIDVSNLTKDTLITLDCFVSYLGKNLTKKVTGNVEASGSEPILHILVTLAALVMLLSISLSIVVLKIVNKSQKQQNYNIDISIDGSNDSIEGHTYTAPEESQLNTGLHMDRLSVEENLDYEEIPTVAYDMITNVAYEPCSVDASSSAAILNERIQGAQQGNSS
ncbi:uncharacterized protein [Apostichopus japonicus]|uniref:uncharacterized protein n=1 Tax=Stichopus japonicus TaxID=307972 RepID=UPI003AB72E65